MAKRTRDAGTGKIVPASEAAARPKETVTEDAGKDTVASLAKRLANVEQALSEDGGRLSDAFRSLSNR